MVPWERHPDESRKAFAAFQAYLDFGDERSLVRVGQELGKSRALMERWSVQHRWQARLDLWEAYLAAQSRKAELDAQIEMVSRHAKIAALIINKVAQRLIGDEVNGIRALDVNTLTASDIRALLEVAVRIERLSRGEPDIRAEIAGADGGPITARVEVLDWRPDEAWMRDYARVVREAGLIDDDADLLSSGQEPAAA